MRSDGRDSVLHTPTRREDRVGMWRRWLYSQYIFSGEEEDIGVVLNYIHLILSHLLGALAVTKSTC